MAYRFVHAADLHLDSPLRSLALRNPALARLVGDATRQALARIVDLCLEERVDALMLAGDLYDGDQTSMTTARFLLAQLRRLDAAGIETFVVRGNHDAESRITRELTFPASVHVFGHRAGHRQAARAAGGRPVMVHGLSFRDRHAPDSLLPGYEPPVADAVNVGLMHTSLGGSENHSPYAPCALVDLQASGFTYWGLGHLHGRRAHERRGRDAAVVMPGMPQGRDVGEAGAKSVTLVTVGDDGALLIEERRTGVAQFERVAVDLGGVVERRDALGRIEAALGAARAAAPSDHLVARLVLGGATPLAWHLRRAPEALLAEVEVLAEGVAAIDRIELLCGAPDGAPEASPGGDPVAELRDLVHRDVLGSDSFRAEMAAVAGELAKRLPRECVDAVLGADPEAAAHALSRLAAEGAEEVLARLREPAAADAS